MIVIGVGNAFRRDDGAGPAVVRELQGRCPDDVPLVTSDGEPDRLIDLWAGADLAVLVDAAWSAGREPGRVHEATDLLTHAHAQASCHGMGLGTAIELGRALNRMPHGVHVYSIEGADFGFGADLSPSVRRAVAEVADRIVALAISGR